MKSPIITPIIATFALLLAPHANAVEPDPIDALADRLIQLQSNPDTLQAFRDLLQQRLNGDTPAPEPTPTASPEFDRVRAILEARCVSCHGPGKQRSAFDLSTRERLLAGGDIGISVTPGNPDTSPLLQMLRHEIDPHMPHKEDPLPPEEIEAIAEWIHAGAPYTHTLAEESAQTESGEMIVTDADRSFWSFRPLARHEPPTTKLDAWARTPIDQFIAAKLTEKNLAPSAEADRGALIRRAYFDLTGLPPTPQDVAAFQADNRPDAYERLIDRLLDSPRYGERWGRHWLDVARYADSAGYEFDVERPTAYHYRDFVITALNEDMPFDQFVRWQLAGDEYEPDNPLALAATGFCTAGPNVNNQETELNRYNELDDMLSTTASAFLGLTMACARCHDHKYDPIPSRDYYSMLSAFTTAKRHDAYLATRAERDDYLARKRAWDKELKDATNARDEFLKPFRAEIRLAKIDTLEASTEDKELLRAPFDRENEAQKKLFGQFRDQLKVEDPELEPVVTGEDKATWHTHNENIAAIEKRPPPSPPRALALTDNKSDPETSYYLNRGNPDLKNGEVSLAFLQVLPGSNADRFDPERFKSEDAESTYQRTALAEWLTDVDEGAGALTARVIVNRLWHHHFGRGIVGTPNDFGMQGDRPTHPQLLDWLATELIERSWSLKQIHKLIMCSAAYRQSSQYDPAKAALDPNNHLLWRREPIRLEAEVIRDAILAVSGCLNDKMFGPGIHPYMHPDAIATGSTNKWPQGIVDGPETWRRSIYIYIRRSVLMPMMQAFDAPDATASCARRNTTTIPIQSLALMNSPFVSDQATRFAQRVRNEAGEDTTAQIKIAIRIALAREATPKEIQSARQFLQTQAQSHHNPNDALIDYCQVLLSLNEFVYIS